LYSTSPTVYRALWLNFVQKPSKVGIIPKSPIIGVFFYEVVAPLIPSHCTVLLISSYNTYLFYWFSI